MKKALILVLTALCVLSALTGCGSLPPQTSPEPPADGVQAQDSAGGEASAERPSDEGAGLEPFTSVEIKAISPDIRLETGEEYGISYRLHGREKVNRMEVVDGTFYFETGFDRKWSGELGDWELVLTIPADAVLEELDLTTVAGDITLRDRSFKEGELSTTAGSIGLERLSCEELELETVAGDITVAESAAEELSAENTAGAIELTGDFGEAEAESVSGDCFLRGTVAGEASLQTISGRIGTQVPAASVEASSVGSVVYNGADQGRRFQLPGEEPKLELKSTSGRIEIQTGA